MSKNTESILMLASMMGFSPVEKEIGLTRFSRLSQEAQDLIVGALIGEFNDSPPEISESVRAEIQEWANLEAEDQILE